MSFPIQWIETEKELALQIGERKLTLMEGDVLSLNAEAIVCPVDQSLNFRSGLAKTVFQAAGRGVTKQRPLSPEPFGKVVVMPGGKLKAKYVFLTVLYGEHGVDKMRHSIRQSVERAIRYAEFLRLKSIAFPILGDPNEPLPFDFVSREMLEQAIQYFRRRHTKINALFFSAFNTQAFDALRKEARQLTD